jgi:hypothetical protein
MMLAVDIIWNAEVEDGALGYCNLYLGAKPLLSSSEGQNNIWEPR